jgi:hypothetical protein
MLCRVHAGANTTRSDQRNDGQSLAHLHDGLGSRYPPVGQVGETDLAIANELLHARLRGTACAGDIDRGHRQLAGRTRQLGDR